MPNRQFKHLSYVARLQLEAYLKVKIPKREIAEKLGVHISTVYREIKRGVSQQIDDITWLYFARYVPELAEERYRQNLAAKGAPLKISKDYELAKYIETRIADGKLTPLSVLGEIKAKALQFSTSICHQTLYSYIEKGIFARLSLKDLPVMRVKKQRKRKVKASRMPRGESIEERPLEIDQRKTFGHWEMDCVVGKTRRTLLVLTERLTRKEIIMPMPNQKTESVIGALNTLELRFGARFSEVFKSITVDNGTEFSNCKGMEWSWKKSRDRTKVYYCHPYSSYERGSNERLNREIRRRLPKGTDFAVYTDEQIQQIEDWINLYPRGVLGYCSANDIFLKYVSSD